MMSERDLQRFMSRIALEPNSGCWLWTAAISKGGYGQFRIHGVAVAAHVVSHWAHKGAVAPWCEVHHKCRVRCCVNPDHLEALPADHHKTIAKLAKSGAGLEPANRIIELFRTTNKSGVARVSELTAVNPSTVSRWRLPSNRGGTNGLIPQWHIKKLHEAATKEGIALPVAAFSPVAA